MTYPRRLEPESFGIELSALNLYTIKRCTHQTRKMFKNTLSICKGDVCQMWMKHLRLFCKFGKIERIYHDLYCFEFSTMFGVHEILNYGIFLSSEHSQTRDKLFQFCCLYKCLVDGDNLVDVFKHLNIFTNGVCP